MQRNLHALRDQRDQHQCEDAARKMARHIRIGPQGAARAVVEDENRGEQSVARDVRHQQNFARAVDRFAIGVPETDESERAKADQLPAEIKDEQVCAINERDKAADEDQHDGVEARRRLVVRHIADGIKQHQAADACAHEGEEHAERVHMKDEGERPIPWQRIQADSLAAADPWRDPGDGEESRQAAQKSEDSLGASGAELRHQNLQYGARKKRAWSHQYEGSPHPCLHVERATVRVDVTAHTGRKIGPSKSGISYHKVGIGHPVGRELIRGSAVALTTHTRTVHKPSGATILRGLFRL